MIVLKILLFFVLIVKCNTINSSLHLDLIEFHEVRKIMMDKLNRRLEIYKGDKHNFGKDRERIWPYGIIPYKFSYAFPLNKALNFKRLIDYVGNSTCIRFRPYRRHIDSHYITVAIHRGEFCRTHYGRPQNESVIVIFKDYCNDAYKMGLHQIMRLLGFEDMQRHPERDNYIEIFWDKIEPEKKDAYYKHSKEFFTQFYGSTYDYHSASHMLKWGWGINDSVVMIPKIKGVDFGHGPSFSIDDIAKINLFYEWECTVRDYIESISGKEL